MLTKAPRNGTVWSLSVEDTAVDTTVIITAIITPRRFTTTAARGPRPSQAIEEEHRWEPAEADMRHRAAVIDDRRTVLNVLETRIIRTTIARKNL